MNTDFFSSPAYCVPPIRQSFRAKSSAMNEPVRVPSIAGFASKDGAQRIVSSGTCRRYASRLPGFRNMLRANRLCHAYSVTTRTGSRYSACAQAWTSCTNRSRSWRKPSMRERSSSNVSLPIGRLYSPHQIRSSVVGSRTMNLSCAAREVWLPVATATAPPRTIRPSPRNTTSS